MDKLQWRRGIKLFRRRRLHVLTVGAAAVIFSLVLLNWQIAVLVAVVWVGNVLYLVYHYAKS
jgi:type IV secretory pathway TrbD component